MLHRWESHLFEKLAAPYRDTILGGTGPISREKLPSTGSLSFSLASQYFADRWFVASAAFSVAASTVRIFIVPVIVVVDDVAKEYCRVAVTTNCIVNRKLCDYSTRVNHQGTLHTCIAVARQKTEKWVGGKGGTCAGQQRGRQMGMQREKGETEEKKKERVCVCVGRE